MKTTKKKKKKKKVFISPLEESAATDKPILSKAQIRQLFSDIKMILNFNRGLLAEIEQRVQNWYANSRIGDIFLNNVRILLCSFSSLPSSFLSLTRKSKELWWMRSKKKKKKVLTFYYFSLQVAVMKIYTQNSS